MPNWARLVAFIVVVVGCGLLVGSLTLPGAWYAALEKPFFNPPSWLFGPAWTVLYVLIGIAGWRVWEHARPGPLMPLWIVQFVVNLCWTPVFFRAQRVDLALLIVLALLVIILVFIALAWRRERTAAWLFVPYAAWVSFASLLNAAIYALN